MSALRALAHSVQRALNRLQPHKGADSPSPPHPFVELISAIEAYSRSGAGPEVLLLGDSVALRVARQDHDRRSLAELVSDSLAPRRTHAFAGSAFHPELYFAVLKGLVRLPHRPSLVVIPINLRCFSPQWHWNPRFRLGSEVDVARRFAERPSRDGSALPRVEPLGGTRLRAALETFAARRVTYPLLGETTLGAYLGVAQERAGTPERATRRRRDLFIFHYLHALSTSHEWLDALAEALNLLNAAQIHTFAYLTPINVDAGNRLVGPLFHEHVVRNARVVADRIGALENHDRCTFLDWSVDFSQDAFFHADESTEHLAEVGRRELAERISTQAKRILGDDAAHRHPLGASLFARATPPG